MTDEIDTPAQMMELAQANMTSRSAKTLLYEHPWSSCLPRRGAPLLASEEAEATKLDRPSTMANKPVAMTQLTTCIKRRLTTIR